MPEGKSVAVTLRSVTREDCRNLWEWRNDPTTRTQSFHTEEIPFKEHERWFQKKWNAPDTRIFIILNPQGRQVGYVRFRVKGSDAEVSVSLDAKERGNGYGPAAIRSGVDRLLSEGVARRVVAFVKSGNPVSAAAFERAGFVRTGVRDVSGVEALEMVYVR